ncbi:MAG: hypothetical protein QG608_2483 [Actinomycetota bacterium]|nr:hypothetical protein [Actinomycetota bacterium]
MTEYVPGGRRRIDRVLAPAFLEGLAGLDLQQIRDRRTDADQEEADLSYARRLLQGRIDLLRAEGAARRGDGPLARSPRSDTEIVEALARILTDGPRRDRGLGRHLSCSPSRVGEHRREAERAVADVGATDTSLPDEEIGAAIERLTDIEQRVSKSRRSVQMVVDTLTEEIARRYRAGEVPALSTL